MTDLPVLSYQRKVAIRSQICAPKGKVLIELDLSAAESWVVAHLSNDSNMQYQLAFGDLHSFTAQNIYRNPEIDKSELWKIERYIGKKTNHGSSYRMSAPTMAATINKEGGITVSIAQVKIWMERWHALYNLRYWWSEIDDKLRKGGVITTAYGKRRRFWGFANDTETQRQATAFEPQSVVSYHMDGKIHPELGIPGGLLEIKRLICDKNLEVLMTNTSHDSVILEAPERESTEIAIHAASLLKRPLIVNGQQFTIPVDCERYPHRWKEDGEALTREGSWKKAN